MIPNKFITSDEFKSLDKKKHNTVPLLRKAMYSGCELAGERQIEFIISSCNVDRDNDKIPVKAWDFKNFMRNPVVLWSHRSDELPIGKCVKQPTIDGDCVRAIVQFPAVGLYAHADLIYDMCKNGFLNATSVGFSATDWDYTTDTARAGDTWKPGIDFKRVELMEFSVVSVPANPDALIQHDYDVDNAKSTEIINTTNQRIRTRAKRVLRILELG